MYINPTSRYLLYRYLDDKTAWPAGTSLTHCPTPVNCQEDIPAWPAGTTMTVCATPVNCQDDTPAWPAGTSLTVSATQSNVKMIYQHGQQGLH
jgi:hypothetical protein